MAGIRKAPDADVLRGHVADGLTTRDMAELYGMSTEGVRQALLAAGIAPPGRGSRTRHDKYIPWRRVRADHVSDVLARRLRSYSKRQQGKPLSPTEARLLDEWIAYMNGGNRWGLPLSVHYDREQGWWLEPQKPGDRDYVSPPPEFALA